jgi:predicted amidohydrolase YtcJ
VSSLNPLECIQVAITHNLLDASKEPWLPHEAITLKQALSAYTRGSAYINFLDEESGSIEVGKSADLVILDNVRMLQIDNLLFRTFSR